MGLTYVEATVTGPTGRSRKLKLMVDSRAAYSLLPTSIWKAIKLKPKRKAEFTLADGTTIERKVSECHIVLNGDDGHTPVILGEPGDDALLGVITLENLGLVLDPFKRELRPMQLRLGWASGPLGCICEFKSKCHTVNMADIVTSRVSGLAHIVESRQCIGASSRSAAFCSLF